MFVETKREGEAAVPTMKGFIAWLETKDPNESYDFADCKGRCLLGQYMAFMGIAWDNPINGDWGGTSYLTTFSRLKEENGYFGGILDNRPWTFGAALKRAKHLGFCWGT